MVRGPGAVLRRGIGRYTVLRRARERRALAALAALVALGACTAGDPTAPSGPGDTRGYVAVYFYDGHGLIPEFRRLPAGDPVAGLVALLEQGSERGRRNFVLPGTLVGASEREGRDRFVLELSAEHWGQPPGEVYAGVAQISYTVADLEDAESLLFLDGSAPGEILDGSFEPIDQPVKPSTFADVQPWIRVIRPAPGATVGPSMPVELALRDPLGRARVELVGPGGVLASARTRTGSVTLELDEPEPSGEASLEIAMRSRDGARHRVSLPLRVSY